MDCSLNLLICALSDMASSKLVPWKEFELNPKIGPVGIGQRKSERKKYNQDRTSCNGFDSTRAHSHSGVEKSLNVYSVCMRSHLLMSML